MSFALQVTQCFNYIISFAQSIGEFVLTDCDMKIKPRGKIYSINEGYYKYFDQETKDYVESVKNPKVKQTRIGWHTLWPLSLTSMQL